MFEADRFLYQPIGEQLLVQQQTFLPCVDRPVTASQQCGVEEAVVQWTGHYEHMCRRR